MAGPHENLEHVEHAEHASHGGNKKIALLISVLALFLAFSETLGKSAQTKAITDNVTANDPGRSSRPRPSAWRVLTTAAEQLQIQAESATDADTKGRLDKRIEDWKKTAARYDDDPKSNEGRKQLMAKARALEHSRELAMSRYHNYEFASAAFQIGIVLASAEVITGMVALAWLSGLCGVLGLAFTAVGLWAPHALRLPAARRTSPTKDRRVTPACCGRRGGAATAAGARTVRRGAASSARSTDACARAPVRSAHAPSRAPR